ncbi:carboxylesterase family protein [Catalinimonas sp. 4WD22]|uniref:carboxylesterase/lipase family protein n=1 Tax=Catalinimonas locisalis TaxID=3133978 RepID=UPI0031016C07
MKKQLLLFSIIILLVPSLVLGQNKNEIDTPIRAGMDYAIVDTDCGKVRGYSHNGTFIFKGIPYGKAERFMPAEKPEAWEGVRSSMTYGPVCPIVPTAQVNDEFEFPFQHNWGYHNENCLNLNVWTQGINDGKKRPVMVWLHGGGFSAGSSIELPSYDGENLSKNGDVVLVSVNHRLNVLGFLDLSAYGEKYKSSANAGLQDLVRSLEWVKANIEQFGGDPNNVTIFGQSGGGGKVTSLMNAPSAKGLFDKAIVQSGSYLQSFMDPELAQRVSAATLKELEISPEQIDQIQKVPYLELHAAASKALKKVEEELKAEGKPVAGFGLGWGPILDGSFLPYQPTEAAALALAQDVPLLVGSTKAEFMPFRPGARGISMEEAKQKLQEQYKDKTDTYLTAVKKAYPGTAKPSDYIDIDLMFRGGAIKQANMKAENSSAPVYMYLFSWDSPVLDGVFKSMHCMELPFVFDNIELCEEMTGGGKEAHDLAEKMSLAWINFARSANPNHAGLPNWPEYTPENGVNMIFDNVSEVKNHHDKELLKLVSGE